MTWICKEGLAANARQICGEFTEKHNVEPIKVALLGPPKSGKSTLASAVSEHFNVAVRTEHNSNTCRYRGFVVDGISSFEEAQGFSVDFVILLQPAREVCLSRGATKEELDSWDVLRPELEQHFIDNISETNPQDLLYLSDKDPEESFECIRIYIEGMVRKDKTRGRPQNFGMEPEDIVTQKLVERMLVKLESQKPEEAEVDTLEQEPQEEETENVAEESPLNVVPTRAYLLENVIPALCEGLIHIAQIRPDDPLEALGRYLEKCTN